MNIFSKIGKVFRIAKELLSDETEEEMQEFTQQVQQGTQELLDVVQVAKNLGKETEDLVNKVIRISTLGMAILYKFQERQPEDAESRTLYSATMNALIEKGVQRLQ